MNLTIHMDIKRMGGSRVCIGMDSLFIAEHDIRNVTTVGICHSLDT